MLPRPALTKHYFFLICSFVHSQRGLSFFLVPLCFTSVPRPEAEGEDGSSSKRKPTTGKNCVQLQKSVKSSIKYSIGQKCPKVEKALAPLHWSAATCFSPTPGEGLGWQGATVNDGFLQAKGPRDGRRHADFLKGFFIRLLHRDGPDVSAYGEGFERKSGTLRIPGRFCRVGGRVGFHV